jgi:transposase-like protein
MKNSNKIKLAHEEGKIPGWNDLAKTKNLNRGWAKGKSITPNSDIFVENSTYSNEFVKTRINKEHLLEYKCQKCAIDMWQGETIVLELDHINGNNRDHRLDNLRYLCPNCHSQTETFRGRNINNGKTKVTDEELLTGYRLYSNIRQTLLHLGLAPKGGNYERLKKLLDNMGA